MDQATITQLEECQPCKLEVGGSTPPGGSCKFCGENTNNPKFCNRSCAASFNNMGIRRHGKAPNSTGECWHCHRSKNDWAGKYCSTQCQQDFQTDRRIESWLFGDWDGCTKAGASGAIRDLLLDVWNHKCSRCGWAEINPTTRKIPLELEHIDGNYRNNSITNLTILCPNCHSLTPTYKALNRGGGREWRNK